MYLVNCLLGGAYYLFKRNTQMNFFRWRVSPQAQACQKKKNKIEGDVFETDMLKALKEICLIPKRKDGRKLR